MLNGRDRYCEIRRDHKIGVYRGGLSIPSGNSEYPIKTLSTEMNRTDIYEKQESSNGNKLKKKKKKKKKKLKKKFKNRKIQKKKIQHINKKI